MGTPEEDFAAELARKKAEREARGIKDVTLDQGLGAAARQFITNANGGTNPDHLAEGAATAFGPGAGQWVKDARASAGAAPAASGELTDHLDPGAPGDNTAQLADDQTTAAELEFRRPLNASAQANAFFEKEGYSKAPVGGPQLYDEAFTHAPGREKRAREELSQLQSDKAKRLADFYGQQSEQDVQAAAAAKAQAAEDQENFRQRQAKLDEAAQYYTNDLQDQGKFWQNPGNIVKAIAFSLMPIFSGDPTTGIRLINQEIDRDMANRQHAAAQTLGALRSNLDGYHKIAGDRQAGDLLARAEAHRIAAQQIQQIALNFDSPIAKKQAEMMQADQEKRYAAAQMEFYKANVHISPSRMDPALHAARYSGEGGYREGIAPYSGASPSAVQGSIQGTPSTASTSPLPPVVSAVIRTSGATGLNKAVDKGMVPEKSMQDAVKAAMYREGHALYPNEPPDQAFVKVLRAADEELKPFSVEISKNAASRRTISALQTKMAVIEALERGEGRDPGAFVGWARKNMPSSWVTQYDQLIERDPNKAANKAEERAIMRRNAIISFEAQLQSALNQNAHDLNGGTQSEGEMQRTEKEVSQLKGWKEQRDFLQRKSVELQAKVNDSKLMLTPAGKTLYRLRSMGGQMNTALPRQGQPGPAKPPAPALEGQVSGGRSAMPPGQGLNSSFVGMGQGE